MSADSPHPLLIRQAQPQDSETVFQILTEAAQWLVGRGIPLWREDEIALPTISSDVAAGHVYLAEQDGVAVGTVRFDLTDTDFWPDMPAGDAAYLHRLAVRRSVAGSDVSTHLLRWAALYALSLGKCYLRLDCEASRPKLKSLYESHGFLHHSDRQVGPYFVSRYEMEIP